MRFVYSSAYTQPVIQVSPCELQHNFSKCNCGFDVFIVTVYNVKQYFCTPHHSLKNFSSEKCNRTQKISLYRMHICSLYGLNKYQYCRYVLLYRRNNKWYHVSEHARNLRSSMSWHAKITHHIGAHLYFNNTVQQSQKQIGGCQERFIGLHIHYIWVSEVYLFRISLQDTLYS